MNIFIIKVINHKGYIMKYRKEQIVPKSIITSSSNDYL